MKEEGKENGDRKKEREDGENARDLSERGRLNKRIALEL